MRPTVLSLTAALALGIFATGTANSVFAMGNSSDAPAAAAVDPNYAKAKTMIEARNYKDALPLLRQVVAKNPRNADAYNLLGFATRKSGDANASLVYYNQALGIDPKHLGAHEYVGEAYLQLGRMAEAEQELAKLDSLCVFGCAEQRTLKQAIADFKAGKKPTN
jgi:Flp pilus assembly protein TadD